MQVQKEEVRQRILSAALDHFYLKGYRGARLGDIADDADVAVSLIYNYFYGKASLYDALVQPVVAMIERIIAEEESHWNEQDFNLESLARQYMCNFYRYRKNVILLWEKGEGSALQDHRAAVVLPVTEHVMRWSELRCGRPLEPFMARLFALQCFGAVVDICRQDDGPDVMLSRFDLFWKAYTHGIYALESGKRHFE